MAVSANMFPIVSGSVDTSFLVLPKADLTAPTYAPDIAAGLLAIARRKHAAPANLCGLLHFAAPGRIDRASMAQAIMDESRRQGGPFTRVSPVSTEAFASPAKRPANACLSSDIATRQLRLDWTPWEKALEQSVRGILARG